MSVYFIGNNIFEDHSFHGFIQTWVNIHDKNTWLLCVVDYLSVDGLLGCFSFLSIMINISITDDI